MTISRANGWRVAAALGLGWCLVMCNPTNVRAGTKDKPATKQTLDNTLTFDHLTLRFEKDAFAALEVEAGQLFQVVISETDPTLFRYTITAVPDESTPEVSFSPTATPVVAKPYGQVRLTMRHDQHFSRYRVTIALIPGVNAKPVGEGPKSSATTPRTANAPGSHPSQPGEPPTGEQVLFPVTFDVWVLTKPEWKVSVSGGVGFSGLVDKKYFIKTDDAGKKTVEEDVNSADTVRTDIVALANVYFDHQYRRMLMFGAAFGIGQSSGGAPRYYLGPSVVLGRNFVFSGGVAFGSVATLPTGQTLSQPPINGDNTLSSLGSRVGKSGFFSVAFTFINKESEFTDAFSSTTQAEGAGVVALTLGDLKGDFEAEGTTITVDVAAKDGKPALPVTLKIGDANVVLLKEKAPLDYTTEDGKKEAKFSGTPDEVTMEYSDNGAVKTLKKKAKTQP